MTEAAFTGVGAALAQAREAQGLALADVALQLKYLPRQLEALEQERFQSLPGATIARGMVRNYARLLKLDPEPLLERLAERLRTPDPEQLVARFRQPVPFSDSGRRSTLLYLALSAVVLALVGAVAYEWRHPSAALRMAAVAPKTDAPVVPAREPAPVIPAAVEAPEPAAVPAAMQAEPQAVQKSSAEAAASQVALNAPGTQRIVLRCEQESWIEVRDGADRLLISSLNAAGTERVVEGRPPFTLVIGNAQHVRVSYNDRPVDLAPHIKVEVARLTLQ